MTKRSFGPFSAVTARSSLVSWFGQPDKVRVSSRDGLNATLIKKESGVLLGWYLVNASVGWRQINFYDQNTQPKDGDQIDWVLKLPPETPSAAEFVLQIPFFTGIAFTITKYDGSPASEGNIEGVLLYA